MRFAVAALLLLVSLFPSLPVSAATGDWQIGVKSADGPLTPYSVTLGNGQVLGKTAGVPAAITPFGGSFSDLSGKPTTLAGYGITDAITASNNLSDLANAATARTNLGLGAAATLATSTGGNTADAGKALVFGVAGKITARTLEVVSNGSATPAVAVSPTELLFFPADFLTQGSLTSAALTASRTWTLPNATGTIITTGNLTDINTVGTITSGTWQGSAVGLAYIAQGGASSGQVLTWNGTAWAPAAGGGGITIGTTTTSGAASGDILTSNGTTLQKLTPGTGVSTWLATPSLANLNAALNANVAILANNTFTGAQTISVNGAASTPLLLLSGTWFTGGSSTTTKPALTIEAATGTAYSTAGTGLGINASAGFAGNLIDVFVNNTPRLRVTATGLLIPGTTGTSADSFGLIARGDGYEDIIFAISSSSPRVVIGRNGGANEGIRFNQFGSVWWSSGSSPLTGSLDLVWGREAAAISQQGADTNGDAVDQTIKSADGVTGTDRSGADLTLASGRGTGAGAASALIFSTPAALSTGTTAQTLTERARITSAGLTIGSSGVAVSRILSTTATWDPANLADGASETRSPSVTVTNAAVGDLVIAELSSITSASWDIEAVVSATNTVEVRITNRTGGAVDLSSGTLRVTVIQH